MQPGAKVETTRKVEAATPPEAREKSKPAETRRAPICFAFRQASLSQPPSRSSFDLNPSRRRPKTADTRSARTRRREAGHREPVVEKPVVTEALETKTEEPSKVEPQANAEEPPAEEPLALDELFPPDVPPAPEDEPSAAVNPEPAPLNFPAA